MVESAAKTDRRPRIVIVGGGFGGLNAARALARADARVILVDRRNHHLFQPLLYQVATASLSPADIAAPIRHVLSSQKNAEVILAEAAGVDVAARELVLTDGRLPYDYLVVATGATHSYFGHEEWGAHAPGLKTVEDAVEIRRRFLMAFESAEREPDAAARRAGLTFVIIGGGPTGVELAGAIIEIARRAIPKDFRSVDTTTARVILVEAQDRLLAAFPPELSARAKRDLEQMGVEVRLGARVTGIDERGALIGSERVEARNLIWAAGVTASPVGATLGAPVDRSGRVHVNPDLSVPGHPEVFVIGDLAYVPLPPGSALGETVPGMAPGAIQMGRYVARVIAREIRASGGGAPAVGAGREPFRYHHKGSLATIGRARAVADLWGMKFGGLIAWMLWAGVHVFMLIGFRNRLAVMIDWAWEWMFFARGARLITGDVDEYRRGARAESAPGRGAPGAGGQARDVVRSR